MKKIMKSVILFLIFCGFASAQNNNKNQVIGLEITAPIELEVDTTTVKIQAKSEGMVKWLVLTNKEIKYDEDVKNKTIFFKDLTKIDSIQIFAVSDKNGNLTEFAYTTIKKKKLKNNKIENLNPEVLVYVDYGNLTPVQNQIINLPYTNRKYNYINFSALDIKSYRKQDLYFPSGILVIKNEGKDTYVEPLPKDLKAYTDILDSIKMKGK